MFRRNVASLQCDARTLPLPDESVDLIVTSPPYFALRDYQDGGQSVEGQVGNEPTPQAFLQSLWACTEEWMRVLKPSGSIFVNLGDKWAGGGGGPPGNLAPRGTVSTHGDRYGFRPKSLLGLPWRYAIGCIDQLGLILREEIIWDKPNGLPESVRDRCRRNHEQLFHFTKNPHYYSAVDRIREKHKTTAKSKTREEREADGTWKYNVPGSQNPVGKLPPSVWTIATQPLVVPKWLKEEMESVWYDLQPDEAFDLDHFAAFPPALVQRIIDGWSPQQVCTVCGQGRFPVTAREAGGRERTDAGDGGRGDRLPGYEDVDRSPWREGVNYQVIGSACACTPYVDHPENRGKDWRGSDSGDRQVTGQRMGKDFQGSGLPEYICRDCGYNIGKIRKNCPQCGTVRSGAQGNGRTGDSPSMGGRWGSQEEFAKNQWGRAPVREYLLDQWEPPPTTQGVVLDPFGGTGTTAIVAAIMGRRGISGDLSFDYAGRLVPWRMNDRGQMRSLLGSKS